MFLIHSRIIFNYFFFNFRFINLCCSNKSVREKNSKEKESRGNTVEEMISQILKNPREKILERKNFKENDQVSKIYRWKPWKSVY